VYWCTIWISLAGALSKSAAGLELPPNRNLGKINRFCRHDDIESFTRFTFHPKSITEIGWYLVYYNFEKKNK